MHYCDNGGWPRSTPPSTTTQPDGGWPRPTPPCTAPQPAAPRFVLFEAWAPQTSTPTFLRHTPRALTFAPDSPYFHSRNFHCVTNNLYRKFQKAQTSLMLELHKSRPDQSPRPAKNSAAKPLFHNILPLSSCGSRFCPDLIRPLARKLLTYRILAPKSRKNAWHPSPASPYVILSASPVLPS